MVVKKDKIVSIKINEDKYKKIKSVADEMDLDFSTLFRLIIITKLKQIEDKEKC